MANSKQLPVDALRRVFSFLDWRSLCRCAAVCSDWRALAREDSLWQPHVSREYFRPHLLAHSIAWQRCGSADTGAATAAAAHAVIRHATEQQQQQQSGGSSSQPRQATTGSSSAGSPHAAGLKDLLTAALVHPAAPHQALLARFHAALSSITGWRVLLTSQTAPAPAGSPNLAADLSTLTLSDGPTTSNSPSAGGHVSISGQPAAGFPAPLTLQALQSGGWACGCVMMQQQEQSCWVRFNLPPELRTDTDVAAALLKGQLAAVLQGLGPSGWFDVATANKFELYEEEMDILLQSHKTGFYAWDQLDEGGVDRYGQLEPLPWYLTPGQQQQQQHWPAPDRAAQQQHPQQQQASDGDSESGDEELAPPELRMLVYVHYQQLLQALPWRLPQSLPLPARPVLNTTEDICRRLVAGPCSLWLQLDVCQLHGGHKLGTCVAPLALWDWGVASVKLKCVEKDLLVVLYEPSSSINSTEGGCPGMSGAAGGQRVLPAAAGSSADRASADADSTANGSNSLTAAFGEEALQQVLLGAWCVYGAGFSREDGSAGKTAADALGVLMRTDEIMVDFGLFDAGGHLLMGRAGVEVWSKEVTDSGCSQAELQSLRQGGSAADLLPGFRLGQAQSGSSADGLCEDLAAHIGPLTTPRVDSLTAAQRHEFERMAATSEQLNLAAVSSNERSIRRYWRERCATMGMHPVLHTRTVQKLHFLVDGVDVDGVETSIWETFIAIDTQPAPAGFVSFVNGVIGTLSMTLPWSSVRGLFGAPLWLDPWHASFKTA